MSKIADKGSLCIHAAHTKLYPFTVLFVEELGSFKSSRKKNESVKALIFSTTSQNEGYQEIKSVGSGFCLLHHHFAFVVKFSFMPVSTVE
jgi:hypothetical protein